jgi:hypothetical protein
MPHMEHFRNGKVYSGDQLLMEEIDGHLAHRDKPGGRKEWFGYFEVPVDKHIEGGAHYTLVLPDGRVAEINAADIRGSEAPGRKTHAVEFYVCGEVRQPGRLRGLGSSKPRLGH